MPELKWHADMCPLARPVAERKNKICTCGYDFQQIVRK